MQDLRELIEHAFDNRAQGFENRSEVEHAVAEVITLLDSGKARVAEQREDGWHVNQWLKKAVLLSFGLTGNRLIEGAHSRFYDKVPMKYADYSEEQFKTDGVRVVPDAIVRRGAFIAPDVVLMPSYVNIGAYVDSGTMVDTWATVGSCEGVVVEKGSVISMGVYLGQSTRIYDRETGAITYGRIPAGSVVVSGNLPSADGSYSLYCAVIVKRVDEKTRAKTGLNELLRNLD